MFRIKGKKKVGGSKLNRYFDPTNQHQGEEGFATTGIGHLESEHMAAAHTRRGPH